MGNIKRLNGNGKSWSIGMDVLILFEEFLREVWNDNF